MLRNEAVLLLLVLLIWGCRSPAPIGERWTREQDVLTFCIRAATDSEIPEIVAAFSKVRIGMSTQEAEAILGKPHLSSGNMFCYLPAAPPPPPQSPYAPWGVRITYENGEVTSKDLNPQFYDPQQSPPGDVLRAVPEE